VRRDDGGVSASYDGRRRESHVESPSADKEVAVTVAVESAALLPARRVRILQTGVGRRLQASSAFSRRDEPAQLFRKGTNCCSPTKESGGYRRQHLDRRRPTRW